MNIFILDKTIVECAQAHCDKHVVKMILESTQMLSTACRLNGIVAGYKATHINHPCSIWARESISNWMWLKRLTFALNKEWKYRFNHKHNHKSALVAYYLPIPNIVDKGLTPFAQAMPNQYKNADAIQAYRDYYRNEKIHLLQYTKRSIPQWI